ncbi:pyocin S6 family toxin immunity protein [Zestomonas carbonaria]|uniref:pyocin S6 family toxin immunity protein n=1 Tax=Zestomonas carbonaria TaxID=2762745 RepID=UPI001656CA1A|nr:pyocin S6 family toxin immunity protein [Pseudomonas carbonaria]
MKREFLYISGFLRDDGGDDSLKYELEVPSEFQSAVLAVMGWESLDGSQGYGWELTPDQVAQISAALGQRLPTALSLFIETLVSD